MNFGFSEEQDAFRQTVRRFLEERSPRAEVLRLAESEPGFDPAVWKQLTAELGLTGVHIPEAYGGQGFGPLELGIALEEMGRALLCAPFFSSACLAANAILNAGSEEQRRRWLPGLAAGESIGTLALLDAGSPDWSPEAVRLACEPRGDGFVLNGSKTLVTDGLQADLLIVAARLPASAGRAGLCLLAVRGDAEGLRREGVEPLDPTRRLADVHLSNVRGEPLGRVGEAGPALARTLDQACVGLAAEAAGGTARCLESAVSHARQRVQFARPIGSFQAIKHKCADLLLELENGRSAAYYAGWVAESGGDDLPLAASVAKAYCTDAFLEAAAENLHIHGGVGFTWAADPHLYLKRARSSQILLGDPTHHRSRIARILGF